MTSIAHHHAIDHRVYVPSDYGDRQLVAGLLEASGHPRPNDREVASAWLALRVCGDQAVITIRDVARTVMLRRVNPAHTDMSHVPVGAQSALPV